jgi:DNA-binding response OmpR family regulator
MNVPPSILSVEDSSTMQFLITSIFGSSYKVSCVKDGESALEWLRSGNKADLIITDLKMPGISGYELLTILKEDSNYASIPVIVLSSVSDSPDKIKLLRAGADDYVEKPFNPEELFLRVANILRRTSNH